MYLFHDAISSTDPISSEWCDL